MRYMVEKIMATSEEKRGMLPMKEGKKQEDKKTIERKNIEICNFIKNAFVVDGQVELITSDKPFKSKVYFKCKDTLRGEFFVAYGNKK